MQKPIQAYEAHTGLYVVLNCRQYYVKQTKKHHTIDHTVMPCVLYSTWCGKKVSLNLSMMLITLRTLSTGPGGPHKGDAAGNRQGQGYGKPEGGGSTPPASSKLSGAENFQIFGQLRGWMPGQNCWKTPRFSKSSKAKCSFSNSFELFKHQKMWNLLTVSGGEGVFIVRPSIQQRKILHLFWNLPSGGGSDPPHLDPHLTPEVGGQEPPPPPTSTPMWISHIPSQGQHRGVHPGASHSR